MVRYESDDTVTILAGRTTSDRPLPIGLRTPITAPSLGSVVRETGRPARIDHYADHPVALEYGVRSSAAAPITVQGRLWGYIGVTSTREEPPPGTEVRLAAFTEIAATAIANSQAREELRTIADEQAALRRVATLVAGAACPRTCSPRSRRRSGACSPSTPPRCGGISRTTPPKSSPSGAGGGNSYRSGFGLSPSGAP